MKTEPYSRFKDGELILRDYLAADRTVLANERTLLSYVRTALALAGGGVALIHFIDSPIIDIVGWALIPIGLIILLVGIKRYLQVQRRISGLMSKKAE